VPSKRDNTLRHTLYVPLKATPDVTDVDATALIYTSRLILLSAAHERASFNEHLRLKSWRIPPPLPRSLARTLPWSHTRAIRKPTYIRTMTRACMHRCAHMNTRLHKDLFASAFLVRYRTISKQLLRWNTVI
jgi:hypothetical protein